MSSNNVNKPLKEVMMNVAVGKKLKILCITIMACFIMVTTASADRYNCTFNQNLTRNWAPAKITIDTQRRSVSSRRGNTKVTKAPNAQRYSWYRNLTSSRGKSYRVSYSLTFKSLGVSPDVDLLIGVGSVQTERSPGTCRLIKANTSTTQNKKSSNTSKISTSKLEKIKEVFKLKSATQRRKIQIVLSSYGLYQSSIDGLFGKRTYNALLEYNRKYNGRSDLNKYVNIRRLLDKLVTTKPKANKPKIQTVEKPKNSSTDIYNVASGTGFFISDEGHIITNNHVISGCEKVRAHQSGETLETLKIANDRENDLALLKVRSQPDHVFSLSDDDPYPLQDVVVAGFPFGERVSSSLKFTKGIISSLSGIGNNYSELQIDAAIQPGNSGGPILDENGDVIAVAVAKLDMKKILKDYGVIPENTNFGIKASAVKNLLLGNGIEINKSESQALSKKELSKAATAGTVFLSCWMTSAQIEEMKTRKVLFNE